MSLGPKNRSEEVIYAEENLRVDFQYRLQSLLNHRKLSRKELAFRAGMTEQAVSRLFSSKANPRLDTVARLFHALGDECIITSRELERVAKLSGWSCTFDLASWAEESAIGAEYDAPALVAAPPPEQRTVQVAERAA